MGDDCGRYSKEMVSGGGGVGRRRCWKEVVGGGGGRRWVVVEEVLEGGGGGGGKRWVVGMVVKRRICKMSRGILFIVNICYHQIFFIKFSAFLLTFRFLSVF